MPQVAESPIEVAPGAIPPPGRRSAGEPASSNANASAGEPAYERYIAKYAVWALAAIVGLAAAVRLWGITFGLPALYHPDEPPYVIIAQHMFKTGDLDPGNFHYPSLFFYLNALAYIPYFLVGKLLGFFQTPDSILPPQILTLGVGIAPMPGTFLLGRGLSLLFGVGSVIWVYVIGRKLTGNRLVGLLAALFMAVSVNNATNSKYIIPDTFVVFFALFALWGAVQVFERGTTRDYIVAGIAIGLTAGTKYNGALIALALVAAHLLRLGLGGFRDKRLYIAAGVSIAAFLVTTPFAIFDFRNFLEGFLSEAFHYSNGHIGMEGDTLGVYVQYLVALEGPVTLLAALRILQGIVTKSRPVILLSVFPIIYFIFISLMEVRNDRTIMPITPFLYLLGAGLLVDLAKAALPGLKGRMHMAGRTAVIAIVLAGGIWALAHATGRLVNDTNFRIEGVEVREDARQWIEENVPPGSHVAIEAYSPYVDPARYTVEVTPAMAVHSPDWYAGNHVDYLVFSQFTYQRYYDEPARFADAVRQYEALFHTFALVKDFRHEVYSVQVYAVTRPGSPSQSP